MLTDDNNSESHASSLAQPAGLIPPYYLSYKSTIPARPPTVRLPLRKRLRQIHARCPKDANFAQRLMYLYPGLKPPGGIRREDFQTISELTLLDVAATGDLLLEYSDTLGGDAVRAASANNGQWCRTGHMNLVVRSPVLKGTWVLGNSVKAPRGKGKAAYDVTGSKEISQGVYLTEIHDYLYDKSSQGYQITYRKLGVRSAGTSILQPLSERASLVLLERIFDYVNTYNVTYANFYVLLQAAITCHVGIPMRSWPLDHQHCSEFVYNIFRHCGVIGGEEGFPCEWVLPRHFNQGCEADGWLAPNLGFGGEVYIDFLPEASVPEYESLGPLVAPVVQRALLKELALAETNEKM